MTRSLRHPDNVVLFPTDSPTTRILENAGAAIHGQGFSRPAITADLSSCYPPPIPDHYNIGMLHTSATGRPGHEPYAPCHPERLILQGYDYWALGHVHQAEILSRDPFVVFSGNIQGRHIRETGAKGCFLVDSERAIAEFRACDAVRWEHILIREERGPSDLMDRIETNLAQVCDRHGEIPVVVRLSIALDGRLRKRMKPDTESLTNDIRALAIDAGDGRIWVQDIQLEFRPDPLSPSLSGVTDALDEIQKIFRELETDPDRLSEAAALLEDFRMRLPTELRDGPDAVFPGDPGWMKEILQEAEAMLTARLSGGCTDGGDVR
jgi:DNA repair exonuclease SbcCD nuclease subunit